MTLSWKICKQSLIAFTMLVASMQVAIANDSSCLNFLKNHPSFKSLKIVNLNNGSKIISKLTPPQNNKLYVFVNGLVYPMERWKPLSDELIKNGNGVLHYEFSNQANTLLIQESVKFKSLKAQAQELHELIQLYKTENVQVHVVGLSYGASIATEFAKLYPKELASLSLMSPIVVSTETYNALGSFTKNTLEMYKFWGESAYETAYEATYRSYFRNNVKQSPYDGVPLSKYQDSLFELGKAVRNFNLKNEISNIKGVPVHLMLAELEEAAAKADILSVADKLKSMPQSKFTVIKGAHHAIPDTAPIEGAAAISYF